MLLIEPAPSLDLGVPEVSLLTSAEPVDADFDVWRAGLGSYSGRSIASGLRGVCDEVYDTEDTSDTREWGAFNPFEIYTVHGCQGSGLSEEDVFLQEAEDALAVREAWMLARELWTGAASGSPSLQSTGTDIGVTTPTDPTNMASYLIANTEDAIKGGQVYLHVPSTVVAAIIDSNFAIRQGNKLVTPTGHVVIPGPGYPNAPGDWGPTGADASTDGEFWMFATGRVEYALGTVDSAIVSHDSTLRWGNLEIEASRPAILRFDVDHVYAGMATLATMQ